MIEAIKALIKIWNRHWYQTGKYLVAKRFYWFSAQKFVIIQDDYTLDAIKQIIKDEGGTDSFVAMEFNQTLQNSLPSK